MAKILSIDDAPSMRQLISAILADAGHEVVTAADGLDALKIIRAQAGFDLILCDVHMPGLSGTSLVQRIKSQPGFEYIPIVMVTTETGEDHKKKARNFGASGWLTKPFTPDRLLKAVEKLVG